MLKYVLGRFGEMLRYFLGAKQLNFEDMYFFHLKVLRKNN